MKSQRMLGGEGDLRRGGLAVTKSILATQTIKNHLDMTTYAC